MQPPMGLMDQGWGAHDTSDAEVVSNSLALIRLGEELGYDSAWLGEHHTRQPGAEFWGRFPAPEIVLGAAAAQTSRIRLGTGVRVLSTTPAMRTAEEMRLLAVLSGGRVDFGIGLGTGPNGLADRQAKIALFKHLLDELLVNLGAEADPPVTPDPGLDLKAHLWAAARDDASVAHVARSGVNLVVGQAEPGAVQASYVQSYREAGGRGKARGVRLVFLAPTDAEAEADCVAAAETYHRQFSKAGYVKEAVERGILPAHPATLRQMLDKVSFIVGGPERVLSDLNAYIAQTGVDQLDVMVNIPRVSPAHAARTMRLLAEEVRPRLVFKAFAKELHSA